jgi:hypothetical protein
MCSKNYLPQTMLILQIICAAFAFLIRIPPTEKIVYWRSNYSLSLLIMIYDLSQVNKTLYDARREA